MAVTLDTTRGGANANAYVTVAEADAVLDLELFAKAWRKLSEDDKARCLVKASRMLGGLPLAFAKADEAQALDFPVLDGTTDGGFEAAKRATIAQAAHIAEHAGDMQDAQSVAITGATALPGPLGSMPVGRPQQYAHYSLDALKALKGYIDFGVKVRRG